VVCHDLVTVGVSPWAWQSPWWLRQSTKNNTQYQGLQLLFYRSALPLSPATLSFMAGVIRRHRKSIGSCWRKLKPGQQALLAYLKKGETFAELAAGFGVGVATAWRYVNQTVELLAARAPKLRTAVRNGQKAGHAYVVVDGTLIPIDRVAADRAFYSGKHKKHGMNLQVIASPQGTCCGSLARCPARSTTRKQNGSGEYWPNWRRRAWSPLGTRGTRAAYGRSSPTRARRSPNPRKPPTAPTRNSADQASARTPSSSHGGFSTRSAAAPGAPGSSPRQFTYCRHARHKEVGKASLIARRLAVSGALPAYRKDRGPAS
jgi:hypothetical protein